MMRIAEISLHGDPLEPLGSIEAGGQNVYVKNIASELSRRGVHVDVFTRWNDPQKPRVEAIANGARSVRLKGGPVAFVKKEKTLPFVPEMISDFVRFSSDNNVCYDLIHTHYYVEGAFGMQLTKLIQVPQAHTFHSLGRIKLNHEQLQGNPDPADYDERLRIEKQLMERCNLLVATSPCEAADFREWYGHGNGNTVVVPCGFDPQIFYPRGREQSRQALGLPQEKKILLYVGRLDWRKGLETLLFAYRKLLYDLGPRHDEVMLVVVGGRLDAEHTDPELAQFMDLASSLNLTLCEHAGDRAGCVAFVGSQDQEHVAQYYSAADACIVPSYYEPFGMVTIEAQACGTPVIASAVGGLKYGAKEGVGGLLAKPYSPLDFCDKMRTLVEDDELQERLAKAGHDRVMRKFTWEVVGRKLAENYRAIVQPTRRIKVADVLQTAAAARKSAAQPLHGFSGA